MMNLRNVYLLLFLLGVIIPYWELVNFIIENGFDFELLFNQLTANRISRFFAYDVIISAIVLFVFIFQNNNEIKHYWIPIIITLTVGVSAGFPLFLYQKELRRQRKNSNKT